MTALHIFLKETHTSVHRKKEETDTESEKKKNDCVHTQPVVLVCRSTIKIYLHIIRLMHYKKRSKNQVSDAVG